MSSFDYSNDWDNPPSRFMFDTPPPERTLCPCNTPACRDCWGENARYRPRNMTNEEVRVFLDANLNHLERKRQLDEEFHRDLLDGFFGTESKKEDS